MHIHPCSNNYHLLSAPNTIPALDMLLNARNNQMRQYLFLYVYCYVVKTEVFFPPLSHRKEMKNICVHLICLELKLTLFSIALDTFNLWVANHHGMLSLCFPVNCGKVGSADICTRLSGNES